MPSSLTTIGKNAFFYNPKLKKVTIPKNVTSIKAQAFAYNGAATYTFKGKKPPKFGSNVFKSGGKKSVIKAPKTSKWKSLLGSKKQKKKIGFTGKVK